MLGIFHMGIAQATNSPEWMLTEDESRDLAKAAIPVIEQFNWIPDPKYAAIGGLMIVAGKLYVPRGIAVAARVRAGKERRAAPAPSMPQPAPFVPTPMNGAGFADFGDPTKVN